jgi:hypothetical protein
MWKRVEGAGGIPFQTEDMITALEFAPSNPSILYLGTSRGELYRGVNGGASAGNWTRLNLAGTSADMFLPKVQVQAIAVNPKNSNDVWVVFGGAGVSFTGRPNMILNPLGISHVFRSKDGGANWVDASGQFSLTNLPDGPTLVYFRQWMAARSGRRIKTECREVPSPNSNSIVATIDYLLRQWVEVFTYVIFESHLYLVPGPKLSDLEYSKNKRRIIWTSLSVGYTFPLIEGMVRQNF